MNRSVRWSALVVLSALPWAMPASARTVYRCLRDNTVSLATAPEPGSRCTPHVIADDAARVPNLWGALGLVRGTLYERQQDGRTVYSTRNLPGSTPVLRFSVATPAASPAHAGLGRVSRPRMDLFAAEFRRAARRHRVDEAFLRAIAHAESAYDPRATSPKGAQGLMQLMPDTARELGVADPYASAEAIDAGARLLRQLLQRYRGDYVRAAAAYNAGAGAVARYGGVPPYRETMDYVEKVTALHASYRDVMRLPPLVPVLRAAQ